MASTGDMISIVSPSVSSSGRYSRTLAISLASWARVSSSQNTAGVPLSRARRTASLTQSRIGTSLVWHMRHTSPGPTCCSKITLPAPSVTVTVPAAPISKVLSWEPYSSAAWAISPTLGTEPIVAGS